MGMFDVGTNGKGDGTDKTKAGHEQYLSSHEGCRDDKTAEEEGSSDKHCGSDNGNSQLMSVVAS